MTARKIRSPGRVFGSVARGDNQPGSDVDFLVEFDKDRTLFDLIAFRLGLRELLGVELMSCHPTVCATSAINLNDKRRRLAVRPIKRYAEDMSRQTAELLEAFDSLAPDEKRVFTAEFLRRAIPFDSGPLDDEETAHAADDLFALLDAEENDAAPR
jgi:predicted nucleotidyltransferase